MKQCPKCNNSCDDKDVVCSNCGYIFPPEGFDPNAFSSNGTQQNPTKNYSANPEDNQNQPVMNRPNWGNPYGNQPMPEPRNSGTAIASLVLGICGTVFGCCYGIGIIPGIIAIIMGIISQCKIKKSNGQQKGSSFAVTGIILGAVGILLAVYMIVSIVVNKDQIMRILQQIMSQTQNTNKY
jgi:rubredoxin